SSPTDRQSRGSQGLTTTRGEAPHAPNRQPPRFRGKRILDSVPMDSIVGKLAGSNGSLFSPDVREAGVVSDATLIRVLDLLRFLDPVRSRVMLATGPSRKKIRIVTHRRSCIAGHAVPALPDPHDCV